MFIPALVLSWFIFSSLVVYILIASRGVTTDYEFEIFQAQNPYLLPGLSGSFLLSALLTLVAVVFVITGAPL